MTRGKIEMEDWEIRAALDAHWEDAMQEIRDGVATRIRFNIVVETGVPGFIPRGR